ncbi:aldehyde dehydrogenase family protein [Sinomonas sp. G460-2]|uniref:aldehyde dehydrogenase family protein n=1 Tax=Sinomonas sp. G460-2 TaxID=3393464 RepID=UPI0039F03351
MKMIINGEKRDARDGAFSETRNVATNEVIDTIPSATPEDIQEALEHAREGAKVWAATPAHRRSAILTKFVEALRANIDELAVLLAGESGKVLAHSRNELETTARIFEGFAEESKRVFGQSIPLDIQPGLEGDLLVTRREPLGVIAAILAFNFPAELYAQKVGAALAAGNAVIVKPPRDDSLTCVRMTDLLLEAGVPGNVLQIITGSGAVAGEYLSRSPLINGLSFTGSTKVGERIAENTARNVVRTFLELNGNDAFIVCDDADLDLAVQHAAIGRLYGNGQVCVATKRILVEESRYEDFLERLTEQVKGKKAGDPTDPSTEIGPLINEGAAKDVENQIQHAVSEGAKIRLGGKRNGAFIEPTILEITREVGIAKDDEIFGPVFSVIPFNGVDEAVEIANDSSFGLGGAVFSKDFHKAFNVASRMETGMVSINGGNCYRPDGSAFGGYKKSGIGREGFLYTLEELTQIKSIVMRGILNQP